jgi:hypothetical protein
MSRIKVAKGGVGGTLKFSIIRIKLNAGLVSRMYSKCAYTGHEVLMNLPGYETVYSGR